MNLKEAMQIMLTTNEPTTYSSTFEHGHDKHVVQDSLNSETSLPHTIEPSIHQPMIITPTTNSRCRRNKKSGSFMRRDRRNNSRSKEKQK